MQTTETRFRIHRKSQLSTIIEGRDFEDENDFLELIEDYLFWKMMQKSETGDYASEDEVFSGLIKD